MTTRESNEIRSSPAENELRARSNIRSIAWRRAVPAQPPPGLSVAVVEELDDLRHEVDALKRTVRVLLNETRRAYGLSDSTEHPPEESVD